MHPLYTTCLVSLKSLTTNLLIFFFLMSLDVLRSFTTKLDTHEPPPHESSNNKEMRTAFSLPAGRTAKSYIASGAGLGRGLGTAGYGGLTRKAPPEIETAAGRATAVRVVPIAIPNIWCLFSTINASFNDLISFMFLIDRLFLR